jgi:hypothetical protein
VHSERGDHLVTVKVSIPTRLGGEEKKLIEKLGMYQIVSYHILSYHAVASGLSIVTGWVTTLITSDRSLSRFESQYENIEALGLNPNTTIEPFERVWALYPKAGSFCAMAIIIII